MFDDLPPTLLFFRACDGKKNQFLLSGGTKSINEMGEKGKVRENGAVVAEYAQCMEWSLK